MDYSVAFQMLPSKILGEDISHPRLLLGGQQGGDRRLEPMHTGSLAYEIGGEASIVVPAVFAKGDQDGGICQGLFVLRTVLITLPLNGMILA